MRTTLVPQSSYLAVASVLAFLCAGWPGWGQQFEWQEATPESQGMSSKKLDLLRDRLAFQNTKALLVLRNDRIVYECGTPTATAR